jgi:hypothetical protein
LAEGCFFRAIPLLTRQLATYQSIGADPIERREPGSVVFDVKTIERTKHAAGYPVAQPEKPIAEMATGL